MELDDDLRELMLWCLDTEKAAVLEDLEQYCSAIAIIVTPTGREVRRPGFCGEDEKIAAYSAIVEEAKQLGATAIVTVNAARTRKMRAGEEDGYWWGQLAAEGARDCISVSVSGPGMESFGLDLAYDIVDGRVIFDSTPAFERTEVGLLPDWPGHGCTYVN